ncbi:hypothetical protein [Rhizobium sp. Leaf384]|uniref:hypothetical protein n=1 Tax=Rhizobium sp. Leaf384 TaxID=1736358 RepID=UPI0012E7E969|nr:hypothetical protein [Rhizobium sp. Leaf384]
MPSTLDVVLVPPARAFLRKLEGAGGRLFIQAPADREHVRTLLPLGLVGPAGVDRRAIEITNKGRAYLTRLRGAH